MRRSFKFLVAVFALVVVIGASLAFATSGSNLLNAYSKTSSSSTTAPAGTAAKVVAPGPSQGANTESVTVNGSGHAQADETAKQFIGKANIVVGAESLEATVTMTLAAPFSPMGNGNQVATTSHRFDFGNGNTLTTSEQLILMPAESSEMFRMNAALGITGGTGVYENARGSLTLNGVMQANLSAADWNINGIIEN